ncbi:MAG: GNAT family N-acetyltransferase [Salinicola sp.]|nr:GNAT family N-acetyltransferase [Salinicola sp.]|tara:strand:+ start:1483 stop:2010 length:528 start_codon:yes stop_codon:yes gene_type:complete
MIKVRIADEVDLNSDYLEKLVCLINEVYADAEAGMWIPSASRTDSEELSSLVRGGNLMLAESEGDLVGVVKLILLSQDVAEFGMLAADRNQRGKGIGSALVAHAEKWALQNGCRTMQLELLTPRGWENESKEFLKKWYSRIGYRPVETQPFEIMYSDLAGLLQTECDFTVWHKHL